MYLDFSGVSKQNSYTYDTSSLEKSEKVAASGTKTANNVSTSSNMVSAPNPNTIRALEAANIMVNDETIKMVEAMMSEGLKIDKESLQNMYRLLLKNPGVPSEQLVKMNALELPITPENIRQFSAYENLSHQLTDSFQSLSDSAFQTSLQLFEGGNGGQAFSIFEGFLEMTNGSEAQNQMNKLNNMESLLNTNKQLLDMVDTLKGQSGNVISQGDQNALLNLVGKLSQSLEQLVAQNNQQELGQFAQQGSEAMSANSGINPQGMIQNPNVQNLILNMPNVLPEDAIFAGGQDGNTNSNQNIGVGQFGNGNIVGNVIGNANTNVDINVNIFGDINANTNIEANLGIAMANIFGEAANGIIDNLNVQNPLSESGSGRLQGMATDVRADALQSLIKDIISDIRQNGELRQFAELGRNPMANPGGDVNILQNTTMALSELSKKVREFVKESLFGKTEFAGDLKQTMLDGLLVRPEEVADGNKMREYFDNLLTKMDHLTNTLKDAGLDMTQLNQSAVSIKENVQFMNQLNQVFQYVQIPLKMSNQNTSGDLYVYTNKKSLADNDGNLSAFLHLDMEYIGPLDVYVQMTKGMNVSTDFYLKDEETIDFIGQHIHILNERLQEKGYAINTNLSLKEDKKEKSVIEHMMDQKSMSMRTKLLSVNSFDTLA